MDPKPVVEKLCGLGVRGSCRRMKATASDQSVPLIVHVRFSTGMVEAPVRVEALRLQSVEGRETVGVVGPKSASARLVWGLGLGRARRGERYIFLGF